MTTREALATLWADGVRQVELAIGVKPSPDTVEVLRHYQQQGMQYRGHHALVWQEHRSSNLAHTFDADCAGKPHESSRRRTTATTG